MGTGLAICCYMLNWLTREKDTLRAYARGVAGGLLFGTPLLFTMEMWWLGFSMSAETLLVAIVANFGILLILERYSGFRQNTGFWEEVQDAVVAQGLGFVVAMIVLSLINLLRPGMSFDEMVGKVLLQTIGISIGISVAISMLGEQEDNQGDDHDDSKSATGGDSEDDRKKMAGFWGDQAISLAGAIFFGLNVAATEEPLMMGLQMEPWQSLVLLVLSLCLVFAITYALQFRGSMPHTGERGWLFVFLNNSTSTCATALLCSAGLLYLFGRLPLDTGIMSALQMIIALGFATSLGAAAARLLI